jgi:hypothetical protein
MNSSSVTLFCKQATCPSSETLLAYRNPGLAAEQRACVALHLAACDFCGAELQLLTEHAPASEDYCFAAIPLSLRRLAEALLSASPLHLEIFVGAAYEKEPLTLTDA